MKKGLKGLLGLVIALTMAFSPASILAATDIKVALEGRLTNLDIPVELHEDILLVPAESLFKALDITYIWDKYSNTVSGTKNGKAIYLQMDTNTLKIDDAVYVLDSYYSKLIDGVPYVPVEAVAQVYSYEIILNNTTRVLNIKKEIPSVERFSIVAQPRYQKFVEIEDMITLATAINSDLKNIYTTLENTENTRKPLAESIIYNTASFQYAMNQTLSAIAKLDIQSAIMPERVSIVQGAIGLALQSSVKSISELEMNIATLEKQIELMEETLKGQNLSYELGLMSKPDLEKSLINFEKLLEQLKMSKVALDNEYINLNKLIGKEPKERYNVTFYNKVDHLSSKFDLDLYVAQCLASSPNIKAAEAEVKSAKTDVELFSPTTGGRTHEDVTNALKTAELKFEDTKKNYEKAIRTAANNLRNLELSIENAKWDVRLAEDAYNVALTQYHAGNVTGAQVRAANFAAETAAQKIISLENQYFILKYTFDNPYLLQ